MLHTIHLHPVTDKNRRLAVKDLKARVDDAKHRIGHSEHESGGRRRGEGGAIVVEPRALAFLTCWQCGLLGC
jgi:hypothetical protein